MGGSVLTDEVLRRDRMACDGELKAIDYELRKLSLKQKSAEQRRLRVLRQIMLVEERLQ